MSIHPNRTRTEQISCRATEAEKKRWSDACKVSGLSTIQLMMRLLAGRLIIVLGLKDFMKELRHHGINLNQAVKYAHQHAPDAEAEIKEASQKCLTVYKKLEKFLNHIYISAEEEDSCPL